MSKNTRQALRVFLSLALTLPMAQKVIAQELKIEDFPKVVFKDDFSSDKLKKEWKFFSATSRIEDGKLRTIHKPGHGSVHGLDFPAFRDAAVKLRFKPTTKRCYLVIDFADNKLKSVHAGHLSRAQIVNSKVTLYDDKFGHFRLDIHAKRKKGEKLDDETIALLNRTKKVIPHKLSRDWHELLVISQGDVMQVSLDGKVLGNFTSKGFGHETKRKIRIMGGTNDLYMDDVEIRMK